MQREVQRRDVRRDADRADARPEYKAARTFDELSDAEQLRLIGKMPWLTDRARASVRASALRGPSSIDRADEIAVAEELAAQGYGV